MKVLSIALILALLPAAALAKGEKAVRLEAIPGSAVKRVILTPKAAERLGIETAKVSEVPVPRTQMVAGLVVPASARQQQIENATMVRGFGGFTQVAAPQAKKPLVKTAKTSGNTWVQITLSPAEWERLAQEKPVRLLPLATRPELKSAMVAQPSGLEPVEDLKRSMLTVYYVLPDGDYSHALNKRMRVELPLAGTEGTRKVVPYSAVYYDARGGAWVYLNPQPLTYERQRVTVEQVSGEVAVLSEGPKVGTTVVSVGASLLYGTEIFGK
jgi:hypothetical protein